MELEIGTQGLVQICKIVGLYGKAIDRLCRDDHDDMIFVLFCFD